jgi:hypothetical protein
MATALESSIRPSRRAVASRGWLVAGIALGVAVAAGGGATWLLALGPARPWVDAFVDLGNSGEICRTEGDATAHAAARVARLQGQLDNFVRQRFDQFLAEARLAQEQSSREAEMRATDQRLDTAVGPSAQLETRLGELRGERSRLLERLTPEHPSIVDVDRQIAEVDRELAALAPAASGGQRSRVAPEAEIAPVAGWKDLVEHCVVEYDQLAAECRRAERQFEEAQVGHASAVDSHLAALGHWSEAANAWGRMLVVPAALGACLLTVAAAALALLGRLAARRILRHAWSGTDRLITSAGQMERWFSLPVVAISSASGDKPTSSPAVRRPAARWLVLPAQLAVAVAVFCLVATTIQNSAWLGNLWGR